MIAEIISIGDELLIGQVVNTNASWIAEKLNNIGIKVHQISTVSDNKEHILQSLEETESRADLIIITGGIGPTKDDITKTTLCEFFNTKLVFSDETYEIIQQLFKVRGYKVTESNRKQAEVPENCKLIANRNGTAPGMWFEKEGKIFISLPGVPYEMKALISESIIPDLQKLSKGNIIFHKTILTQGLGESFLSETIANWEDSLPAHIKLAYLPSPGIVRLRLSAYSITKSEDSNIQQINNSANQQFNNLKAEVEGLIEGLKKKIGEYIYGYDDDTLERIIGRLLKEKEKTICTAESSTGGFIAHRITSIAGSSAYFKGSIVAYANEIKENLLGVSPADIIKLGAVSEHVAKQMAIGAKHLMKTDYAIAVTGIAGPDGGTDDKPVGTTWIAVATPTDIIAKKFLFRDNRERNIIRTTLTALNILRKQIEN